MKYVIILLWAFLWLSAPVQGQDKKVQSQDKKAKMRAPAKRSSQGSSPRSSKEMMPLEDIYLEKAEELKDQPIEATKQVEKALSSSIDNNNAAGEIKSYASLGDIFKHNKQYDLAIQNYEMALKRQSTRPLKGKKSSPSMDVNLLQNLAWCYEQTGAYTKALAIHQSLITQAQNENNPTLLSVSQERVAFNLWKSGRIKSALDLYLTLAKEEDGKRSKTSIINIYNRLGDIYLETSHPDLAKNYYNKALKLANASSDEALISQTTDKISKVYRQEKDYESEIALRSSQLSAAPAPNTFKEQTTNNLKLGEAYLEQNKAEEAIPRLERSIALSQKAKDPESRKQALKYLSEAYAKNGQYNQSIAQFKKYTSLQDSLLTEREKKLTIALENYKRLVAQNNDIQMLQKDKDLDKQQIANLQKQRLLDDANLKRQKFLIYGLVIVLMVLFLLIYFIQKSNKQKRIANQLLALKSLRSQMNPHFIFNSLNSVNHYIMQNDERAANKYLSDFAKLMRSVMENSQEDFVALSTEIDIIGLYLKLEYLRFSEKFDYVLEVDPDIDTERYLIPPMLVQPYIENAIWHGLRYKEEKGLLKVSIREELDVLKISVEDNGIGRRKSQELKTKNQRENTSTGMKNTKERVAVMNELYQTKMKVVVTDLPNDTGTRIEIVLNAKVKAI